VPAKPALVDLSALPPVACPCGLARRAFADRAEFPGTVHLTEISQDAQEHYHQDHTEVYVILECEAEAAIELDGVRHPVTPLTAILIPPGIRHRACGKMTVLILCSPNFDPKDEHF
jgi:quercetin dioxygenase-like cupin family protein